MVVKKLQEITFCLHAEICLVQVNDFRHWQVISFEQTRDDNKIKLRIINMHSIHEHFYGATVMGKVNNSKKNNQDEFKSEFNAELY